MRKGQRRRQEGWMKEERNLLQMKKPFWVALLQMPGNGMMKQLSPYYYFYFIPFGMEKHERTNWSKFSPEHLIEYNLYKFLFDELNSSFVRIVVVVPYRVGWMKCWLNYPMRGRRDNYRTINRTIILHGEVVTFEDSERRGEDIKVVTVERCGKMKRPIIPRALLQVPDWTNM